MPSLVSSCLVGLFSIPCSGCLPCPNAVILLSTSLQLALLGEHVDHAGGSVLTIDARTVAAGTLFAHILHILLTKETPISVRMAIAGTVH